MAIDITKGKEQCDRGHDSYIGIRNRRVSMVPCLGQHAKHLPRQGHDVRTSDLHEMHFNPVSGRKNFTSVKDKDFFKQQIEEMHATEMKGFAEDIETEMLKVEWCDLMI